MAPMRAVYLTAAGAWMWLIHFLSTRPAGTTLAPSLPYHTDKILHAAEFAVLGFLLVRGLGRSWRWAAAAALLAAGYGLFDELGQRAVSGRGLSPGDLFFDFLGASAGAAAGLKLDPARLFRALGRRPGAQKGKETT